MYYFCLRKGLTTSLFRVVTFKTANKMKCLSLMPLLAAGIGIVSCNSQSEISYEIVPAPKTMTAGRGSFLINDNTLISLPDSALFNEAGFLSDYIAEETGKRLAVAVKPVSEKEISIDIDKKLPEEGYELTIGSDGVSIRGGSSAGVFYGAQTLRKCLASDPSLPAVKIEDEPAFGYRGAHFDVSRHFFTVDEVKTYIDMMALHNMNMLHWHLTEDQGWRVEIKKYPRLTEVGAWRKETIIGNSTDVPKRYDGKLHGGYYTQEQIRDIVSYAAKRHINVIPEIDLPGHMLAALASYPELGCTGGPYEVWTTWGVSDDVLCAGNPKIYEFLDNVFEELLEMFPSEYIHIGGDECPKTKWQHCPKCQALISKLGLTDDGVHTKEQKLQSYVMKHVTEYLGERGRKVIGWDEILEGGVAPGAIVMSWRGEKGGIEAAKAGHDVIMTPKSCLYFDFYQGKDVSKEPLAIGGYTPVENVYMYNPVPAELNAGQARHILGVQANLWTEYVPDFRHAQYMVLPRWAALAENQWRNPAVKDYDKFLKAVVPLTGIYEKNGYNYAKHIFDVNASLSTDVERNAIVVTLRAAGDPEIRYTTDGSEPTLESAVYTSPLEIRQASDIRAATFRNGENGAEFEENISFNKATATKISLGVQPSDSYKYGGAIMLVDGLRGNTMFSSGRWLGFADGDGLDAVIDLGEPVEISSAGASFCIVSHDGIFDAKDMTISVSDDGKEFRDIARADFQQVTEETAATKEHVLDFAPVKTRYVNVKASSEGDVPSWNWLAGSKAWLFVDEIIIR